MSKQSAKAAKRPYRKRRRAQLEEETRLKITEAAVDLHGSIGPARTTISAVADRAGVQRATVYRHFPAEEDLFAACSSHWAAQNPRPELAGWAAIADPTERLGKALRELYDWYDRSEYMLEKTTRDVALVPAMRPVVEVVSAWFEQAVETLTHGRPERGARRRRAKATIAHALSFPTWRSLVREQGLSEVEAVALMVDLVEAAATS